jgi:hypothetical protein
MPAFEIKRTIVDVTTYIYGAEPPAFIIPTDCEYQIVRKVDGKILASSRDWKVMQDMWRLLITGRGFTDTAVCSGKLPVVIANSSS